MITNPHVLRPSTRGENAVLGVQEDTLPVCLPDLVPETALLSADWASQSAAPLRVRQDA
jgi:hypothetical protein